jgi:hypothetical protein
MNEITPYEAEKLCKQIEELQDKLEPRQIMIRRPPWTCPKCKADTITIFRYKDNWPHSIAKGEVKFPHFEAECEKCGDICISPL